MLASVDRSTIKSRDNLKKSRLRFISEKLNLKKNRIFLELIFN